MTYTCPVCGYNGLKRPAQDELICPCCGVQFGYDDFALSHEQIRENWLREGAHWFSHTTLPPLGWTAEGQLLRAGLNRPLALQATQPQGNKE